jgi:putative DNA primase/helicase
VEWGVKTLAPDSLTLDEEDIAGLTEVLRPEPRRLTGVGNAQRFVDQHHRDLRYVNRRWIVWDGVRFQPDETGEVIRKAKATVASIYAEAAGGESVEQRRKVAAWAARSESAGHIREMVSLAECELALYPDQMDSNSWYLTVANGTVDLHTGRLLPHLREHLNTKLAPVPFDGTAECPMWLKFLDRIFAGDQELIAFIQRAVGYSLTGETSEQVLFLLYGPGANGKTTLLECLRALLGDYASQADFSTFLARRNESGPRNDVARLRGARFVAAAEAGSGRNLDENLVKQLIGGDTVTARYLYREAFEFQPRFKLWLAANHKPEIRGTGESIWRRIRLVPFAVIIPEEERNKGLPTLLRAELAGILQWAIKGCLAWQQQGLGIPPTVREAGVAYRRDMDRVGEFIDCCTTAPDLVVDASRLYQAYTQWCRENGEVPMPPRGLGLQLKEKGFTSGRGRGGVRRWNGLSVGDARDAQ